MADIMSNGRLELGIARGAYQYEFDRMLDIPQSEGAKYMNELVPAVQGLWQGDHAHHGDCYDFPASTSVPKPMQQPHPPIWIAARGQPSHDFAVASGCNVMGTPLSKPDSEVKELVDRFEKACEKCPADTKPELMISRQTVALEDAADWRQAVDAFIDYGRQFENLFQNLGEVRNGFPEPASREAIANRDDYDPDTIRRNQMIGTPDQIIERIRQYSDWGVDHYCFHIDNGMVHEDKKRSLELFINNVVPAFV
jgi:alkanesulfonate monooxygenase SsuD/methylene tetrahydromethanopterin reductase-like flavin-dependent oxidoreductase (luciferase family)